MYIAIDSARYICNSITTLYGHKSGTLLFCTKMFGIV